MRRNDPTAPYRPPNLSSELVYATQAINSGKADERQQTLFMRWLIVEVCEKDGLSYRPGDQGSRDTDFAEGKRFVALSVAKAINYTPEMIVELRLKEQAEQGLPITEGDEIGRE